MHHVIWYGVRRTCHGFGFFFSIPISFFLLLSLTAGRVRGASPRPDVAPKVTCSAYSGTDYRTLLRRSVATYNIIQYLLHTLNTRRVCGLENRAPAGG